ncbi:MAG: SIMPL domain-containing protein [Oscillospiraceae bacterium]|nr:SIMPL domain-containing protein [Oscillospiraceae bacterium]
MNSKPKILAKAFAIAVVSVAAFTFSLGLNIKEASAASIENKSARTIQVTGTSSIKANPDIAILNVGVTTNGTSTTSVQSDNTKVMNKVLASVKALGVADKDIKTVNYYMNPEYDQSNTKSGSKIVGYTLSNMVQIKVRDVNKAGEVLAAAVDAGANVNNGITFSLSNSDDYYNQALSNAMANAKSKADTIAKAIGVKIGVPSTIIENNSYYTPYFSNNVAMGSPAPAPSAAAITQGEIEITANVSVTYEY